MSKPKLKMLSCLRSPIFHMKTFALPFCVPDGKDMAGKHLAHACKKLASEEAAKRAVSVRAALGSGSSQARAGHCSDVVAVERSHQAFVSERALLISAHRLQESEPGLWVQGLRSVSCSPGQGGHNEVFWMPMSATGGPHCAVGFVFLCCLTGDYSVPLKQPFL